MMARSRLVLALVVPSAAAWLALSSCSSSDSVNNGGDATTGIDSSADGRATEDAAPDALDAGDAADAYDAADACAQCASGACGDGGCDPAVFVTSKQYMGAIGDGGVVAADQECASLAAAAGIPGKFQAWIAATGAPPPAVRFTSKSTRPYRLLDGRPVASDFTGLNATLVNPISVTEKRVDIGFAYVWTGANPDGTPTPGAQDCAGWTSSDGGATGATGESDDTVAEWAIYMNLACTTQARLYCFEQPE